MRDPTSNRPKVLILSTREAVQELQEQLSRMTEVDYDLNQIGSCVVDALANEEHMPSNVLNMLLDLTNKYNAEDADIARAALTGLTDEARTQLAVLGAYEGGGSLDYMFDGWMDGSMVLRRLPH